MQSPLKPHYMLKPQEQLLMTPSKFLNDSPLNSPFKQANIFARNTPAEARFEDSPFDAKKKKGCLLDFAG